MGGSRFVDDVDGAALGTMGEHGTLSVETRMFGYLKTRNLRATGKRRLSGTAFAAKADKGEEHSLVMPVSVGVLGLNETDFGRIGRWI